MQQQPAVIAMDGPAASGKTTIGRLLANEMNYLFLDTGCMYRAVTLAVLNRGVSPDDEQTVTQTAFDAEIEIQSAAGHTDGRAYTVLLDGEDVTWTIRSQRVDTHVSTVSSYLAVRREMVERQRAIGDQGNVIMVGRDIGTVVLPQAPLKLYITASAEERARRRLQDRQARQEVADYEAILADIIRRDEYDSNREHSPLRPAADALIIDTSDHYPRSDGDPHSIVVVCSCGRSFINGMSDEQDVWLEVCLIASEDVAEEVAEALRPFAEGESVALEQLGDPADLDPQALLPDVYLKLYLNQRDDSPALRHQIEAVADRFGCQPPTFTVLDETDWAHAWKENYRPFRLGPHFWVQPSWESAVEAQPNDTVITLDPGMAFGTGLHATTQLCFELLSAHIETGMSVLDVGCGSGILSIAAAKKGAGQILAVDNDEAAVAATAANAMLNQADHQIEVRHGSLEVVEAKAWTVVVVNILAAIIMPMLKDNQLLTYADQNGYFIFSGIVDEQAEAFESVLNEAGGVVLEIAKRDGWVAFLAKRK